METCLKNYKEATKVIHKTWGAGNFLTYDALIFQLLFHLKHKVAVSKTTRPPPPLIFLILPSISNFRDNPGHLPLMNESNSDTGYLFPGGSELK